MRRLAAALCLTVGLAACSPAKPPPADPETVGPETSPPVTPTETSTPSATTHTSESPMPPSPDTSSATPGLPDATPTVVAPAPTTAPTKVRYQSTIRRNTALGIRPYGSVVYTGGSDPAYFTTGKSFQLSPGESHTVGEVTITLVSANGDQATVDVEAPPPPEPVGVAVTLEVGQSTELPDGTRLTLVSSDGRYAVVDARTEGSSRQLTLSRVSKEMIGGCTLFVIRVKETSVDLNARCTPSR